MCQIFRPNPKLNTAGNPKQKKTHLAADALNVRNKFSNVYHQSSKYEHCTFRNEGGKKRKIIIKINLSLSF